MQDQPSYAWPGVARFARMMGGSRWGQLFGALIAGAFFAALAYLAWWHKELTAYYVVYILTFLGLRAVWHLLPLSEETRVFWKNEERLSKDHPFASYTLPVWGVWGGLLNAFGPTHPTWPTWNSLGTFAVLETVLFAVVIGNRRRLRPKESGAT